MTKEQFNDQSEKIKHELLNYYSFNQDVYLISQKWPKVNKEKLFKGINVILTTTENEENILRSPMGTSSQRENDRQVDLRRETSE